MNIVRRGLQGSLRQAAKKHPVLVLEGMRDIGKTTLAKQLVEDGTFAEYRSFQDRTQLEAAKLAPAEYINSLPFGTVIDEAQLVEEITLSMKELVDVDPTPGRFLLTGSERLTRRSMGGTDPLVGRTSAPLRLLPFTQVEKKGFSESIVDPLFEEDPTAFKAAPTSLGSLYQTLHEGGLPRYAFSEKPHPSWYDNYIRGVLSLATFNQRDIAGLESTFRYLCGQTSRLVNLSKFGAASGRDARTISDYVTRFESAFLLHHLPGWRSERYKSETASPKIHVSDTSIAVNVGRIDVKKTLGPLLESYVFLELLAQSAWSATRPELFHWRDSNRSEIDLILSDQSRVVCIEIKASSQVTAKDFGHIRSYERRYPELFHRGYVFYTGSHVVPFGKQLWALPLSVLREGLSI